MATQDHPREFASEFALVWLVVCLWLVSLLALWVLV